MKVGFVPGAVVCAGALLIVLAAHPGALIRGSLMLWGRRAAA